MESRELQLEKKESEVRTFEADLHRREKQLTDLILKNDRYDRGMTTRLFTNGEDTGTLSNMLKNDASSDLNLSKSIASISVRPLSTTSYGQNIDQILKQFQSQQATMIERESQLQQYLSRKEEALREQEVDSKIEASLSELFDRTSSPGVVSNKISTQLQESIGTSD